MTKQSTLKPLNSATHAEPSPWHSAIPTSFPVPAIPRNTSPVPWLTSLHGQAGRGNYGRPDYPGNCSGLLIRDLLLYFKPRVVLDPMTGGGTCRDVCGELGTGCVSFDLADGFDATDPAVFTGLSKFDLVWLHPPYWRMVRYSNDPRCLSNAQSLAEFFERLRCVIRNCASVLSADGKLAILMGDGRHDGEYLGLPFRTFNAAVAEGFWLAAPEIIRFSHGTTSSGKSYRHSFIPRLHDTCLVLKRRQGSPRC
jgi:hypothetical protein